MNLADLNSLDQERIAFFLVTTILFVAFLVWLLRRRTPSENVRNLERFWYGIRIRSVPLEWRRRSGRVLCVGIGTYGIRQNARTPASLLSYNVLDELELAGFYDLDTQQMRKSFNSVPTAVGVVALYPISTRHHDGQIVEKASPVGFGLAHRKLAEVEKLRHLWEPPLDEFLEHVELELQRSHLPAPAMILVFLSPGGHALLGRVAVQRLRQKYPNSPIYGITVVPKDPGNRQEFAEFLDLFFQGSEPDLDGMILTDNGLGNEFLHDDMVAHLLGADLQDARESGSNPANILADSTIPRLSRAGADQHTRLLSFEYVQVRTAMVAAPMPSLLRRLLGHKPQLPQSSPAVLVQRADEVAALLAEGKGTLAGPAPLATNTRTSLLLGVPSNDPARFGEVVRQIKARYAARRITNPNDVHFMVARLSVPTIGRDEGAPLVGLRLGEIQGTPRDLIESLKDEGKLEARAPASGNGAGPIPDDNFASVAGESQEE